MQETFRIRKAFERKRDRIATRLLGEERDVIGYVDIAGISKGQHLTPEAITTMATQRARAQLRATSPALSEGMASTAQSTGSGRVAIPG